jgi:3D-(3,5/4)-trihydroxycyclohexane-1,2-dione acylhydrolase (decyclizing)
VTAAAVAHVNRLPLLLIPGDVFANRGPIRVAAGGRFRRRHRQRQRLPAPVSRYFDRLTRPEQVMSAFARAMAVLTDPAECGPVTLAFCQDVQTEAFDSPLHYFSNRGSGLPRVQPRTVRKLRRPARRCCAGAQKPIVVAGGWHVLYVAEAERALTRFLRGRMAPASRRCGKPRPEGKSANFETQPPQYGRRRALSGNHGRQYACPPRRGPWS